MTFEETLKQQGIVLTKGETTTLQVNAGRRCDLACRHCHLEAGPTRGEVMSRETMAVVIDCAQRFRFAAIDLTGGAPELVPGIEYLVGELARFTPRFIVRTNLVALHDRPGNSLMELYRNAGAVIAASLPATNAGQTEAQRGSGAWKKSIETLNQLNTVGYGREGSGLELNLVANPTGAFLPAGQVQAERKFRLDLERRHGITFNNLFTFANVPLGRFLTWLESSGNLAGYREKLANSFNPCTVPGLMCRSLISVDWDGFVYDCDFNLAAGLPHSGERRHISQLVELPVPGIPIPLGDHCYACTAGSGFT
jgi:radical SAM/Cys-rich protein